MDRPSLSVAGRAPSAVVLGYRVRRARARARTLSRFLLVRTSALLLAIIVVFAVVMAVAWHCLSYLPTYLVTTLFPDGMVEPGQERLGPKAWTRGAIDISKHDRTERFIG
jgi:hypothetical protein